MVERLNHSRPSEGLRDRYFVCSTFQHKPDVYGQVPFTPSSSRVAFLGHQLHLAPATPTLRSFYDLILLRFSWWSVMESILKILP